MTRARVDAAIACQGADCTLRYPCQSHLDAAIASEQARLDEKLYLEVFATPSSPRKPAVKAARR